MELFKTHYKKTNITYNKIPTKNQNNRIKSIKKRIRMPTNQIKNNPNLKLF